MHFALASKPGTSILRRLVTRHGPWQSLRRDRIWARRPPARREGGSHAENTGGLTLLLVQPRTDPNRAGADRQPQEQRERDHVRHGLSPKPIQPAESDQQIERQATGADLDHEPF